MRHVLAIISLVAAAGVMTAPVHASGMFTRGDGNASNGEKIFKEGKGDVPACMTCHGEDGSGNDDMGTPAIAGQGFSFLLKQLEDFASDKRQDTTMFVMNANAKGLTPEDKRDVATFLAHKKGGFKGSDLTALKEAGTIEIGVVYKGKALVE
jgi:cytochrome c553